MEQLVTIPASGRTLRGQLVIPEAAVGGVILADGAGKGRYSPRSHLMEAELQRAGLATLRVDLLEEDEREDDEKLFDIDLLANRLSRAAEWLLRYWDTRHLHLGYVGASTGAGAALVAAARQPSLVKAVVSRGGRADLAGEYLPRVEAPTLLIVGGRDELILRLNEAAHAHLHCPRQLAVIPRSGHLFTEPGALAEVAMLTVDWLNRYLDGRPRAEGHDETEPISVRDH